MPTTKRRTTTRRKTTPTASINETPQMVPAQSRMTSFQIPSSILVIALIVLSFFAGYLFFKVQSLEQGGSLAANNPGAAGQQAPAAPTNIKIEKPDPKKDHWKGSEDARYVWVEFSDFECPFCKTVHPSMVQLMEGNKDVAWVYRQFPLSFHQNAQKEAEASECIADLGGNDGFWNFADKIFERTTSNGLGFALDQLGPLAAELGIDQTSFQQCLDSGKFAKKVTDSLATASKEGVQATPTGVIYDMKTGKTLLVEGALPYDSLKQQLDTFIAANK